MVHKVAEKKGFTAKVVGVIKNDPLLKPFTSEEEEFEGKEKKKEKAVDSIGVDI